MEGLVWYSRVEDGHDVGEGRRRHWQKSDQFEVLGRTSVIGSKSGDQGVLTHPGRMTKQSRVMSAARRGVIMSCL